MKHLCIALLLLLTGQLLAQSYGIPSRPAFTAYNSGSLPTNAPTFSGNWSVTPAFPSITFYNALGVTELPGQLSNDRRMVTWEREGKIYSFPKSSAAVNADKTLMLDISSKCQGWDDCGLMALAFHPNFGSGPSNNRYVYLYYTWVQPGTVTGSPTQRPNTFKPNRDRLARFTVLPTGIIDPDSETILIDQVAASVWHNGSGLFFHPDNGFLYLTNGDDAQSTTNSQRIDRGLFSGVIRIDVDQRGGSISKPISRQPQPTGSITQNYYIPLDNPFVGQANALEEFWCIGLRSPHRMTLDPVTKRIFIGDVGLGNWEEISVIEPNEKGLNFQWDKIEGLNGDLTAPYLGINKRPIIHYSHAEGGAVIGGYVYRGSEFATDLGGKYLFADNVSGSIWYLDESTSPPSKVGLTTFPNGLGPVSGGNYVGISSFGLDADGELYMTQMSSDVNSGRIYKLQRTGAAPPALPATLSATGLFNAGTYGNNNPLSPVSGYTEFKTVNPLWSDRAYKYRWFGVPTGQTIGYAATGEWSFPAGSVFLKHFDLPVDDANPSVTKRLETRVLVRDDAGYVYGMTYKWRADNSDADLITSGITEDVPIVGNVDLGTLSSTDIGGAATGATAAFNGGYAVTGGGSDIFGTADQFRFLHSQKTGDFDIATRIESVDRADLYSKAGLMVRESLTANSRNVMALVFPSNEARNNNTGGYEFQYRATTGGGSAALYPPSPQPQVRYPNTWLRLKRQGDVFTAYHAKDGKTWTAYANYTLPLPATVYFGMAITSHSASATATARFHFNINRTQPWYFPGRQDCLACHTQASGAVLGMNSPQANSNYTYTASGISDNQLRALNHAGYFNTTLDENSIPSLLKLAALSDTTASAEHRVRSYFDSNCSHCHRPGGVHAFWDGRIETPLGSASIVNGIIQQNLGVNGAKMLVPQSVDRSIAYLRMATATEHYKMPPLAKNVVDQDAIAMLEQWIGEATQPPADPLPSPWLHADIGSVGFTGDATYSTSTETFIMSASGSDIWDAADSMHFTYQPLTGDGEIIARVQSMSPTDAYTKTGVMIRESTAPGARNALMTFTSSHGAQLQYRSTLNGNTTHIEGPNLFAPNYLRIRRQGDVITGYIATTLGAWQEVGSTTLSLGSTPLIGLALTAHNNAQTATALFDTVSVRANGLPLELKINFQTANAPVPEGYLADTGAAYSTRGNGFIYGWDADNTADARDRNNATSPDQRYDTLNHMQRLPGNPARSWQIALPNGSYSVHLVAGDPLTFDSTHHVQAEGTTLLQGTVSTASPYLETTSTVTVADGTLTLTQGPAGVNTKLCYIDITAATTAVNVALTAPQHQSTHYGAAASSIELTATATTSSSGASITQVEFYDGLTLIGSDNTAPFSHTWTTATAGSHSLMAKATDSTGAIGFSSFSDIVVSADGPFGLTAEYWPNISMSGTPLTRLDENVQFDWAGGVPMAGLPNDLFSARWRGRIKAPVTGIYTFKTATDDGCRLWVNGQLLIDRWVNQGANPAYTSTISLTAGSVYEFEMHYFENFGGASALLSWSVPSLLTEAPIPSTAFFNPSSGTNYRPRQPDILIPTVDGELSDPVSLAMSTSVFEDQDAGQTHAATEWQIWTTGGSPTQVWGASITTGGALIYASLTHGSFLVGTALANDTTYQLRVRHRDSSAAASTEWSPWAQRSFLTTPPDDPRGVTAEYYAGNTRLSGTPAVTRTENNINYDYGNGAPPSTTTVGTDNFSVRWRARIKPQFSETYTFKTLTDDGVRLWVNGVQLVDKWVGQGATPWTGSIQLVANQYYDLEMQYFDGAFGASAKLYWSSPSQPEEIIPALRLYAISGTANHRPLVPSILVPSTELSPQNASTLSMLSSAFEDQDSTHTHGATDWEIWTAEPNATRIWSALNRTSTQRTNVSLSAGTFEGSHTGRTSLIPDTLCRLRIRHKDSSADSNSEWSAWSDWRSFYASTMDDQHGLLAEYYPGTQSFQGTSPLTRTDLQVNFNWFGGEPFGGVGTDGFTVRWRGRIKAPATETFTFKTSSDDGARLYVNGQLLIDQFVYQGTISHTGSISLTEGQFYELELHYLEGGGDANVQLYWSSTSRPEEIIPSSRLYAPQPSQNRRPRAPDVSTPAANGLLNAATGALQAGAFTDLDTAQSHAATDWEIWTPDGSTRVWHALNQTGAQRYDITLNQGSFTTPFISSIGWNTAYQLRVRHRDSSGSAIEEWSPYSNWRSFTTSQAPWNTWRTDLANFSPAEQANPAISGETADPDNDGLSNLLEYAFRLHPKTVNASPAAATAPSGNSMQVTFPVNVDALDVTVTVETSSSLEANSWTSAGITYTPLGAPANGVQTLQATVPVTPGEPRRFARVKAVK